MCVWIIFFVICGVYLIYVHCQRKPRFGFDLGLLVVVGLSLVRMFGFYGCVVVECGFVQVPIVFGVRLMFSFSNARAVGRPVVGTHFRCDLRFRP